MRNKQVNIKMISIHDYKTSKLKKYYGSTQKVYRQAHVEKILSMWNDLKYIGELFTRTRLVPSNEIFLQIKAIPAYNGTLKTMKLKYPNIKEFQSFKQIEK